MSDMTLREWVRAELLLTINELDNSEGFGKLILHLSIIIGRMARIYAMVDQ